jgi:hypothetical protein
MDWIELIEDRIHWRVLVPAWHYNLNLSQFHTHFQEAFITKQNTVFQDS